MTPAVEGILLQKSKIEQPYGRRDAAAGAARLAAWRSKNEVDDCVAYRRQAWLEVHCFFFSAPLVRDDDAGGRRTLLVRLDQPLKAKRPNWAQQPCQIPCSFERRLLADLAIFPMDHTMVASR
jgi:hypothetical protein